MTNVAVVLADGFEEIEAVTIIDVLRRAELEVTTLGVGGAQVMGSHGIRMEADALLSDGAAREWDAVILPGGLPGSHTLRDTPAVQELVRKQNAAGRWVGAICAAPVALGKAGVLNGRRATSYPGHEGELAGATCVEDSVVVDEHVVTSRGVGTALEFALTWVAKLRDQATADKLRAAMLVS